MSNDPPPASSTEHAASSHQQVHLIELLLPLHDQQGQAFPQAFFDEVRAELTDLFGGVTAFVRSPAVGAWQDEEGQVERDDVVLFEVMTNALDQRWWARYRVRLEQRFEQQEIVVRATSMERL